MTTQTPAQRVQAFRQRKKADGLTELRGVFLPPAKHKQAKELLKTL